MRPSKVKESAWHETLSLDDKESEQRVYQQGLSFYQGGADNGGGGGDRLDSKLPWQSE